MAYCTSAGTSSKLRPFITTQLSLTRSNPASRAASMPPSTWRKSPLRVIARKRSGSRLSRLIFMRLTPASTSGRARRPSCEPLLVMTSSRKPGNAAMWRHSSTMPGRISGSPPVRRILRTPWLTNTVASRCSSSRVNTCWRGRKVMFFAMQYTQRKSQRSVTDNRR